LDEANDLIESEGIDMDHCATVRAWIEQTQAELLNDTKGGG
jgi:hypothetical protein